MKKTQLWQGPSLSELKTSIRSWYGELHFSPFEMTSFMILLVLGAVITDMLEASYTVDGTTLRYLYSTIFQGLAALLGLVMLLLTVAYQVLRSSMQGSEELLASDFKRLTGREYLDEVQAAREVSEWRQTTQTELTKEDDFVYRRFVQQFGRYRTCAKECQTLPSTALMSMMPLVGAMATSIQHLASINETTSYLDYAARPALFTTFLALLGLLYVFVFFAKVFLILGKTQRLYVPSDDPFPEEVS